MLIAVALWTAPNGLAAKHKAEQDPLKDWFEGPVRYLMNRTETRLFRSLQTHDERLAFVKRFWDRRDPDPRTAQNEARMIFWQRVMESNQKFRDTPKPGWKTDRGKIYILLGPPFDISQNLNFDVGDKNVGARGLLRWHYRGLERSTNTAEFIVAFYRDTDGDYRLSTDPRLSRLALDVTEQNLEQLPGGTFSKLFDQLAWGSSQLSTAMDLGALQEVPNEQDLVRTVVEAEQFVGSCTGALVVHPLGARDRRGWESFAVTVAVRSAQLRPLWDGSAAELSSRFIVNAQVRSDRGAGPVVVDLGELNFVAEPTPDRSDPWIRFQTVAALPTGDLSINSAVLDRVGGNACTAQSSLVVEADDPQRPTIAGPVLAISRADAVAEGTAPQPFRLGPAIVIPRLDSVIPSDQPVVIALSIAAPRGADAPVALSWSVTQSIDGGAPQPFASGGPIADGRGPRAWEFPAGKLPLGRYTIELHATSSEGVETIRSLSFDRVP